MDFVGGAIPPFRVDRVRPLKNIEFRMRPDVRAKVYAFSPLGKGSKWRLKRVRIIIIIIKAASGDDRPSLDPCDRGGLRRAGAVARSENGEKALRERKNATCGPSTRWRYEARSG